jgi:DsbC/DsbD-like thiol-disulfide interchange protein
MNRRQMNQRLAALATTLLPICPAGAAVRPWSLRLLTGSFDGRVHSGAIIIDLREGWKTYWRVPGAGGVPPDISITGDNIKSFSFKCPLPTRLTGPEGENIGYKHEVGFPFHVEPQDATRPVEARIAVFAGVCESICIPIQHTEDVTLTAAHRASEDQDKLQHWIMKVPQPADVFAAAHYDPLSKSLVLTTTRDVQDVFIECAALPLLFNAAPRQEEGQLRVTLSGIPLGQSLAGATCRLTVATAFGGLEQLLHVS